MLQFAAFAAVNFDRRYLPFVVWLQQELEETRKDDPLARAEAILMSISMSAA